MEDSDVHRSSYTHNNMICLSCHGANDLTLDYISREPSLIIRKLELMKKSYLYKSSRIEDVLTPLCFLLLMETPFSRADAKVTMTCVK